MKLNFSREWMQWAAEMEEGVDIGAGVRILKPDSRCRDEFESSNESSSARARSGQEVTPERLRYCIRLVIADCKKAMTRRALDSALHLILDDDLRAALLGPHRTRTQRQAVEIVGLNFVLQEMELGGSVRIENGRVQQRVSLAEPFVDPISVEDARRLREAKQIVEDQKRLGRVTETEDVFDAQLELVPA